jgi:hypothetical protein
MKVTEDPLGRGHAIRNPALGYRYAINYSALGHQDPVASPAQAIDTL